MKGELEKWIERKRQRFLDWKKEEKLSSRQRQCIQIVLAELRDFDAFIDAARKEFLAIEETELPIKVNGKVDWQKTAEIMELRNIIRLKWFEKRFGNGSNQERPRKI